MINGPVDFVAVGLKAAVSTWSWSAISWNWSTSGIVRIIDAVVVIKDEDGEVEAMELEDLDAETVAMLKPLTDGLTGMVSLEDIAMIGDLLENDTRVVAILFENLWPIKLREAALRNGGQLLIHVRLPDETVQQAWEDMSGL